MPARLGNVPVGVALTRYPGCHEPSHHPAFQRPPSRPMTYVSTIPELRDTAAIGAPGMKPSIALGTGYPSCHWPSDHPALWSAPSLPMVQMSMSPGNRELAATPPPGTTGASNAPNSVGDDTRYPARHP